MQPQHGPPHQHQQPPHAPQGGGGGGLDDVPATPENVIRMLQVLHSDYTKYSQADR